MDVIDERDFARVECKVRFNGISHIATPLGPNSLAAYTNKNIEKMNDSVQNTAWKIRSF